MTNSFSRVRAGESALIPFGSFRTPPRVSRDRRGNIEHVQQHAAAFDVFQELIAEAFAFARAFDESRHVAITKDLFATFTTLSSERAS